MKFHGPATIADFDYDRASVVLFFFCSSPQAEIFFDLAAGFWGAPAAMPLGNRPW